MQTTDTGAQARQVASRDGNTIDDENSRDLFTGYACAARGLVAQISCRGFDIAVTRPLVVYLPCGVGGGPGGIAYGLNSILGASVTTVLVEPVAPAGMLVALASGATEPPTVYDLG